jgi:peptidoglycan/LPS O-acetylase OafA/YrhL
LQLNTEEFLTIFLASFVLHLFVEAPFNNIRKLMFDKKIVEIEKKIE